MKVLWLSPSDITTEPVILSLTGCNLEIHRYDRNGLPVDRAILDRADQVKPDLILYTGQNNAPYMPQVETFLRLRQIAKTVLICHDGSDATWIPVLEEYHARDAFDLVVNIDGNTVWPQRPQDFTALTPIPPESYRNLSGLSDRPVDFAFAGGYSSQSRRDIVEHLLAHAGLVVPRRNEQYGSYAEYARFLRRCRIVLNVPWSGSDNAVQVKGRVLEAGMAGCCLLEHETSAARHWFNAGIDYAVYRDREDAVDVVEGLLAAPDHMQHLADKLHARVTTEHAPAKFWAEVFKGVGLA